MIKLYPNLNFLNVRCGECGSNVLSVEDLKKLAEQIVYDCYDIKHDETRYVSYDFKCKKCQKKISRNLIVERVNSILIVE